MVPASSSSKEDRGNHLIGRDKIKARDRWEGRPWDRDLGRVAEVRRGAHRVRLRLRHRRNAAAASAHPEWRRGWGLGRGRRECSGEGAARGLRRRHRGMGDGTRDHQGGMAACCSGRMGEVLGTSDGLGPEGLGDLEDLGGVEDQGSRREA